MPHYKYLIIGGGMTADAAVKGIRSVDESGTVGLISQETSPPYKRPPLTKGLWKGKPEDSIWLKTADYGIEMHLGKRVELLDANARRVRDDLGIDYTCDRLLLATGGIPRRFPFASEGFIYYRTFADYKHLRKLTEQGDKFAVIGSGFIGSEIAAALAMNNKQVTMIFPEESIGQKLYPTDLAHFLNDYYRGHGVELLAGETITGARMQGSKHVVTTQSGREIEADAVVAGIGIVPNTGLAERAGLEVVLIGDLSGFQAVDFMHAGEGTAHMRNRNGAADDQGDIERVDDFLALPAFFAAADQVIGDAVVAAQGRGR